MRLNPPSAPLLALAALAVACGGDPAAPKPAAEQEPEVLFPTCDAAVGGPADMPIDGVEAQGGFDEALAAIDFAALPEVDDDWRSVLSYALVKDIASLGDTFSREEVLGEGPMGQAVLGAFAGGSFDSDFLLRGLHRYYDCQRAPPLLLADFRRSVLDYTEFESTIVD